MLNKNLYEYLNNMNMQITNLIIFKEQTSYYKILPFGRIIYSQVNKLCKAFPL